MPRITFQKETVTELQRQLHEAYALGDVRLVRRIAVLLAIARGEGLSQCEEHQPDHIRNHEQPREVMARHAPHRHGNDELSTAAAPLEAQADAVWPDAASSNWARSAEAGKGMPLTATSRSGQFTPACLAAQPFRSMRLTTRSGSNSAPTKGVRYQ
jgi:hypothetical protein